MVETAIVMPMMLLILTGILAFGVALNNYLVITNAVNTGVQLLAISRGQTSDPCKTVAPVIATAAPYLVAKNITLTFTINGSVYSGTAASSSCTAGAANMVQGQPATILATYPCTLAMAGLSLSCNLQAQTSELIQ